MSEPVIFLAFANQAENPLKELSAEDSAIYETLTAAKDAHLLTIHRDQHTTSSAIISMLGKFRNRVSIFHYGGHAASAHLYLVDQPVQGPGLIQLLAQQKHLRLVFLNGCNTSGFIRNLLDAGISAIIATSRAVEDPLAVKLAAQFYTALTGGATIGESFAFAKAALETEGSAKPEEIAVRGIRLPAESKTEFPWGLYYKDAKALEWKLSDAVNDLSPLPSRFWVRFAALALAIFAVFIWGNIHFGYQNLTVYLTIGPLALITILSTLFRLFGKKYARINAQIGKPLHAILNFFLNPVVLGVSWVLVLSLFMFFTSVCIDHSGNNPLKAKLTMLQEKELLHWRIASNDREHTRLLAMSAPGMRTHKLDIEDYEGKIIHYNWLGSARIPLDSLQANPAVLLRIPIARFPLRWQFNIDVLQNNKPFLAGKKFGSAASILLGNERVKIPDTTISSWKKTLLTLPPAVVDVTLGLWQNFSADSVNSPLHYGDTLTLTLKQVDSVWFTRQYIVQNKILTDVLLH